MTAKMNVVNKILTGKSKDDVVYNQVVFSTGADLQLPVTNHNELQQFEAYLSIQENEDKFVSTEYAHVKSTNVVQSNKTSH